MKRPALLFAILLCATSAFAQEKSQPPYQDSDKPKTAGTIVFYREGHYTGAALKPSVFVDGKEMTRLPNGRWFSTSVDSGKHELQSSAKHEAATVVDVAPGETAYVQMVILTGNWRGGGRLIVVDPTEAKNKIAKLKPLEEKKD